jgi:predicted Zn-dependent protease
MARLSCSLTWRKSYSIIASLEKSLFFYLLLSFFIALSGCSGSGGSSGTTANAGAEQQGSTSLDLMTLYSTVSSINVHIAYEPNAVPFTGTTQNGIQFWSILESNLEALFLNRTIQPGIDVPKDLSGMDKLSDQAHTTWTATQIADLAQNTWNLQQTSETAEFFVLFLNGDFEDNQGNINKNVIGISVDGTPVIAVFKDVILASGLSQFTKVFIEQATVIHEFGHTLGLVNNGVPMVTDHEDKAHPHHCSNEDCVMFWSNDSTNLVIFINKIINSPSDILFGQECLDDTRSYKP